MEEGMLAADSRERPAQYCSVRPWRGWRDAARARPFAPYALGSPPPGACMPRTFLLDTLQHPIGVGSAVAGVPMRWLSYYRYPDFASIWGALQVASSPSGRAASAPIVLPYTLPRWALGSSSVSLLPKVP
jgi:hypothetical protein